MIPFSSVSNSDIERTLTITIWNFIFRSRSIWQTRSRL